MWQTPRRRSGAGIFTSSRSARATPRWTPSTATSSFRWQPLGSTIGNQMLGGYDESMEGSPMGTPVSLIEESGTAAVRPPRSQDIAATVLGSYYLESGKDFFIPGGYGILEGVIRPA